LSIALALVRRVRRFVAFASDVQIILADKFLVARSTSDFCSVLPVNDLVASLTTLPISAVETNLLSVAFNCVATVGQSLSVGRGAGQN
jgi:hypothetical protein